MSRSLAFLVGVVAAVAARHVAVKVLRAYGYLAIALALTSCAPVRVVTTPGEWQPRPPDALRLALVLRDGNSGACLGFPSSATQIRTVAHCTVDRPTLRYEFVFGGLEPPGLADVTWTDAAADLAILTPRARFNFWLEVASEPPTPVQRMWFLVSMPGMPASQPARPMFGFCLGLSSNDGQPSLLLWGLAQAGTSGSPVMGEDGKVYGVVAGPAIWNVETYPVKPVTPGVWVPAFVKEKS